MCKLCVHTIVRLVDGALYSEGRVEVYYNGEWGTVCDNSWDDSKAKVVCIQLGLGPLSISADFGPGMGRVLLDSIVCSKSDVMLTSCGHYGIGITPNCDHSKDVGVKCFGKQKFRQC